MKNIEAFFPKEKNKIPLSEYRKDLNGSFMDARQYVGALIQEYEEVTYRGGKYKPTAPPIDWPMGLELEVEGVRLEHPVYSTYYGAGFSTSIPASYFFRAVEDGSLRENGHEFVSRVGLSGNQILIGLKHLLNEPYFESATTSYRTSVHVHVSALDLTLGQLKRVIFWYLVLEPFFFEFSGRRTQNLYCVPLFYSDKQFRRLFSATSWQAFCALCSETFWYKYCALNINPINSFGTIEFRHHAGTVNYEEIEKWLLFIWQFILEATNPPTNSFKEDFLSFYSHWEKGDFKEYISWKFGFYLDSSPKFSDWFEEHLSKLLTFLVDKKVLSSLGEDVSDDFLSTSSPIDGFTLDDLDEPDSDEGLIELAQLPDGDPF